MDETDNQAPGGYKFDPARFQQVAKDEGLSDMLDTAIASQPKPRNTGAPVSSFWERVKGVGKNTGAAVAQGAMNFVDETSNSIVSGGATIAKHTRLYKAFNDAEGEAEFLKHWEQDTDGANVLQFGEDRIERWTGPKASGMYGLVSGVTQYALGMMTVGKVVGNLMGTVGGLGTVAKVGREMAKGAAVDLTVFDPHAERLSNAIKGTFLENPVSRYLAAEEDDGELEGRLKGALEGVLIGGAMDAAMGSFKALKLARKGDAAGAVEALRSAEEAAAKPKPTDVATIRETEDGFEVVALKDAEAPAPKFASREEAQNVTDTLNYEARLEAEGLESRHFQQPEVRDQFRKAFAAYMENGDLREASDLVAQYAVNPLHATNPTEIHATYKALVDIAEEASSVSRKGKGVGDVLSHEQTAHDALAIVGGNGTPEEALTFLRSLWGDAENLPARITAGRMYLTMAARKAHTFSRLADEMPENAVAIKNLADALDELHEVHAYVSGSTTGIARALNAHGIDAGALADQVKAGTATAKHSTESVDVKEVEEAIAAVRDAKATDAEPRTRNPKDTDGLTASEWSRFNALKKAREILKRAGADVPELKVLDDEEGFKLAFKNTGDVLKGQVAPPHVGPEDVAQASANTAASRGQNPVDALSRLLDKAESELTSALDRARNPTPRANPELTPIDLLKKKSVTSGLSKRELRDLARAVFMGNPENPGEVLAAIRGTHAAKAAQSATTADPTGWRKARDVALSWRVEAMLSAVTTHAGNMASNTMATLLRPAEYWWAGKRMGGEKGQVLSQMGKDMLAPAQLFSDVVESWHMMSKAFRTGKNVLEGSNPYELNPLPAVSELTDGDGGVLWGNALRFIGRLPSRTLMAGDEFFKQMNYRMNSRAQIMRQAREEGVTVEEMGRRLKDMKKFLYTPEVNGKGGEAVNAWALNYSRVSTFTNELGQIVKGVDATGKPVMTDSMGKRLQDFANNHTVGKLILPFVRTPVNIFRFAHERTPGLNTLSKAFREDMLSNDPERIAIASAKAEIGGMVWAMAGLLAYNKVITGRGPSDPKLRAELQAAGWQPYSIRIGDRYVSFRKADPVFTSLSIAADMVEAGREMMASGDDSWMKVPAAFMAAVASSVTSKSFLQGLSDTFDAIASGRGEVMQALVSNTAGSFIPNILRKADMNDGIMETRGLLDEMMARTPGFSDNLEPKRNLFGEAVVRPPGFLDGLDNMVNPFTISGKVPEENVMNELVKLGKAIPMPSETMENGTIDLTDRDTFMDRKRADGQYQSPYDRWMELMGETGLKEELTALVTSDDYKQMTDDEKHLYVSSLVQGYTEVAKGQMLSEYPSVLEALGQSAQINAASLSGGPEAMKQQMDEIKRVSKLFVRPKARYNPAMPQ